MITPEDAEAIAQWVETERHKPWPLDSGQLDLIRRALGQRREPTADRSRSDAA